MQLFLFTAVSGIGITAAMGVCFPLRGQGSGKRSLPPMCVAIDVTSVPCAVMAGACSSYGSARLEMLSGCEVASLIFSHVHLLQGSLELEEAVVWIRSKKYVIALDARLGGGIIGGYARPQRHHRAA